MNKRIAFSKFLRYTLGTLLAFLALNAFGGGYYGISGAEGVSLELLDGSPFESFLIPSLILFIVVGGSALFASIAVFAKSKYARMASFANVLIVFGWLSVQVAIIGYISWMQPATASLALVILVLTWFLPKRQFVSRYF
ncbi:MAG: hypothetical protein Q8J88_04320 [Bacteroidales bacterium]|nr:hypothetical protein [Bacteroidales bacterium]